MSVRKKKLSKSLRRFASEAQERVFWSVRQASDDVDWSSAERVLLPELKPSTVTISLNLSESLLSDLKLLAKKRAVPYQSLLKRFLAERVEAELRHAFQPSAHTGRLQSST